MATLVSICIPTLNRSEVLGMLLTNIHQHDYLPDEIIIVDASDNTDTRMVCEKFEKYGLLKYIHSDIKQLTYQRNIAIREARGDYILFLDDDIILEKGCIKELKSFLDGDEEEEFAAVGPVILNEFGKKIYKYQKLYYKLRIYDSLQPGTWLKCGDFIQNSFFPKTFYGIKLTSFLAAGTSMFRRKVIEIITPDSSFKFGGEDKHWTLRLSSNYKLGIIGTAGLYHNHFPGGGRNKPLIQGKISMINMLKILQDCNNSLTFRRKVFFQLYTFIDLNRQLWSKIFYLKANGYSWIIGGFIGWVLNLCSIIKVSNSISKSK